MSDQINKGIKKSIGDIVEDYEIVEGFYRAYIIYSRDNMTNWYSISASYFTEKPYLRNIKRNNKYDKIVKYCLNSIKVTEDHIYSIDTYSSDHHSIKFPYITNRCIEFDIKKDVIKHLDPTKNNDLRLKTKVAILRRAVPTRALLIKLICITHIVTDIDTKIIDYFMDMIIMDFNNII